VGGGGLVDAGAGRPGADVTRRRRAAALLGLALVLGALAASDVSGREAALRRGLGPAISVVVARGEIPAGGRLGPRRLAVRRVPARYAPAGAFRSAAELSGLHAAVAIPAGADLEPALVDDGSGGAGAGAPVRPGERVAQVLATGPAELLAPGSRVDVVVTREGASGAAGATTLALEDVEVLAAGPAVAEGAGDDAQAPRVALSLRVTLRQAVYLAAAQSFARELRVLPRAIGDRRRTGTGLRVGEGL
jgi:pilus assembly protein CpaB